MFGKKEEKIGLKHALRINQVTSARLLVAAFSDEPTPPIKIDEKREGGKDEGFWSEKKGEG